MMVESLPQCVRVEAGAEDPGNLVGRGPPKFLRVLLYHSEPTEDTDLFARALLGPAGSW